LAGFASAEIFFFARIVITFLTNPRVAYPEECPPSSVRKTAA
jgi:hypothetical protein